MYLIQWISYEFKSKIRNNNKERDDISILNGGNKNDYFLESDLTSETSFHWIDYKIIQWLNNFELKFK